MNNPVMFVDPSGWEAYSCWKGVFAFVGAVLIVSAVATVTFFTGGSALIVLAGAGVGLASGFGVSAITQLAFTGTIDVNQLLLDASVGIIMGAFGASTISAIGNAIAGGIVGAGSSVASDLMNGESINIASAILSGVLGVFFSYGCGAQYSKKTPEMIKQIARVKKLMDSGTAHQNQIDNAIRKLGKMAYKTYNLKPMNTIKSGIKLNVTGDLFSKIVSVLE